MGSISTKLKGYYILKELSKREYCTTIEVKEEKSGEIKIIKIYGKKNISKKDEERYKCCLEKLRILNLLHICKVEDIKNHRSNLLIVMSKYSNCLEIIKYFTNFKDSGIEEILKTICECIKVFHANGLIYGNIKPSNILISEDNCYYLSDYFCNILTRNMDMGINEISYLSPEVIKNNEVSKKSDIWSIGCLIYYLLSGKKTFEGETTDEIKMKVLKSEYKELDCQFNELVNPLIKKLLKTNLKERMSMNELTKELEKIQCHMHIHIVMCNLKHNKIKEKGNECFKRKEYTIAIKYYSECLQSVSNNKEKCEIHFKIGKSYYYLNEYPEALISLQEALKYDDGLLEEEIKSFISKYK